MGWTTLCEGLRIARSVNIVDSCLILTLVVYPWRDCDDLVLELIFSSKATTRTGCDTATRAGHCGHGAESTSPRGSKCLSLRHRLRGPRGFPSHCYGLFLFTTHLCVACSTRLADRTIPASRIGDVSSGVQVRSCNQESVRGADGGRLVCSPSHRTLTAFPPDPRLRGPLYHGQQTTFAQQWVREKCTNAAPAAARSRCYISPSTVVARLGLSGNGRSSFDIAPASPRPSWHTPKNPSQM